MNANPKRGSPGFLLKAGEYLMLIDAGPGTLHRAARAGFNAADIDIILLTHLHLDHIAEIPFLLFSLRIGFGGPRWKPLFIVGPPGLSDHYTKLKACYGDHVMPGGYKLALKCKIDNRLTHMIPNAGDFQVLEGKFYQTGLLPPPGSGNTLLDYRWYVNLPNEAP